MSTTQKRSNTNSNTKFRERGRYHVQCIDVDLSVKEIGTTTSFKAARETAVQHMERSGQHTWVWNPKGYTVFRATPAVQVANAGGVN